MDHPGDAERHNRLAQLRVPGFGAYAGWQFDKGIGVVALTNEANVGFPDAVGAWVFDRLLGNPDVDHVAERL